MIAGTETPLNDTAEAYFADAAISHSKIKVFRHCRRKFYEQFVTGTMPFSEPTAAMELGTACHTALLEPEKLDDLVRVIPAEVLGRGGAKSTKAFDAWSAENSSFMQLKQSELDAARRMADSIRANPVVHRLLALGPKAEQSLRWKCEKTGLDCKARLDLLAAPSGVIADIKTTPDPSPEQFARAIAQLGYQRQGGYYSHGFEQVFGVAPSFLFIAVGKEYPHPVGCYEVAPADIKHGFGQCQWALEQIKRCRDSGDWSEPYEKKIIELELPKWSRYSNEYEVL